MGDDVKKKSISSHLLDARHQASARRKKAGLLTSMVMARIVRHLWLLPGRDPLVVWTSQDRSGAASGERESVGRARGVAPRCALPGRDRIPALPRRFRVTAPRPREARYDGCCPFDYELLMIFFA